MFKIIDDTFKYVKTKLPNISTKLGQRDKNKIMPIIVVSFLIIIILEMLSRRSIFAGLGFIITNPLMFFFNVLIVLVTMSATMMFSRRLFMMTLVSVMWLSLGLINFILMSYRSTPLTSMDFFMLKSVIGIIPLYLSIVQIILIAIMIVIVIAAMFYLWKKLKKNRVIFKIPLFIIGISAILMLVISSIALKINALSNSFGNLPDAFSNYGFAYCFSNSIFDLGIKEPDEYSEEYVHEVKEKIEKEPVNNNSDIDTVTNDKITDDSETGDLNEQGEIEVTPKVNVNVQRKPNIIMVQLESFFDVNLLLDYSFSENPVPNFTLLKEQYSSGFLTVPSFGAGTANTEFEVLTGMNNDHFGTGEYPYKTILQSTTSESIPYNLAERGYHSHVIHNNTAIFYDRHKVFPKLGFDSFNSIEYMNDIEYNHSGWAKDKVLTVEIMKALQAFYKRDFIYTISVQPHGKYPETAVEDDQKITVRIDAEKRLQLEKIYNENKNSDQESTSSINETEAYGIEEFGEQDDKVDVSDFTKSHKNRVEYFVNQLAETDQFIGELVEELSDFAEPTVVVFFGDHLPSLSIENEDLLNHNVFQTEYVLWSNFPMENKKRDLESYQLSAYVMERLNYDNGVLTKFHQRCSDEPNYQEELMLLQYDMLYGNRTVYEGINPYIEKTMQMGIINTSIADVYEKGEAVFIIGDNFTPWSVVYMDDEPKETIYVDKNTLIVPYEKLKEKEIFVGQVTDTKILLSKSEIWNENNE
ncbi:sulfatase-like hydrolase/transferase [Mobilitalea sibirica]|uniref:Sulfatase-like hydrolase/transferase n=1 Tax=Mobilitalea sibirica TaxID=1462919 RepID=A0A8J7H274_9FIRM|nr:alkaline phosphatase family protein [Mobilitalea sibirica]MBH1940783.1 sulfatase-like hydrolase/transferase [Mobilitalea sibirica]